MTALFLTGFPPVIFKFVTCNGSIPCHLWVYDFSANTREIARHHYSSVVFQNGNYALNRIVVSWRCCVWLHESLLPCIWQFSLSALQQWNDTQCSLVIHAIFHGSRFLQLGIVSYCTFYLGDQQLPVMIVNFQYSKFVCLVPFNQKHSAFPCISKITSG